MPKSLIPSKKKKSKSGIIYKFFNVSLYNYKLTLRIDHLL